MEAKDRKERLIPPGRGIGALHTITLAGALKGGGFSLFTAGRLAKVIPGEFKYGELPSGLNFIARDLPHDEALALPEKVNDFHYHRALFRYPNIYPKGKALGSDAIIEIVDSRFIFTRSIQFPEPRFSGWIEGLDRGSQAQVIHVAEKIEAVPPPLAQWQESDIETWNREIARLEAEPHEARKNAVSILTVNVSLAIRNAFDRIAEHRADKSGQPARGLK
ncbi:MAG: hypothetical protein QOD40_486 [Alphaproteobacteria bacterium]|nr:hypothetical protein [Alphaproteobacteria bacterium]